MSLIARGFGEGGGLVSFGFGASVEVVEEVIIRVPRMGGVPREVKVRRTYVVLTLPVYGRIRIPIQIIVGVFGSLHYSVETVLSLFGGLRRWLTKEVPIYAILQIPIEVAVSCISNLKIIYSETVPLLGKKTYRKLKLLFAVLDEED